MSTMMNLVLEATWQTAVMVFLSTIFSMLLGFPIGVLLHVTGSEESGGIIPHLSAVSKAVHHRQVHISLPQPGDR